MSGGGVWRLKFLSTNYVLNDSTTDTNISASSQQKLVVLASCMRVGCKILAVTKSARGDWEIEVLAQTAIHESMNYASDFVPLPLDGESSTIGDTGHPRTIVSTSFYDRLLFVWRYDPGIVIDVDELES
jgi:diphthamide biosynthesis protein 7